MPDVSVVAICYTHPGGTKIVLVHSREHAGREPFLKFPGGRREPGETAEEAAIREVKDETGISLEEKDLVLAVKIPKYGRGENYDYHIFLAVADSLHGIKSEYEEEDGRVLVVLALDLDELNDFPIKVLPEHRPWVEELQAYAAMMQS